MGEIEELEATAHRYRMSALMVEAKWPHWPESEFLTNRLERLRKKAAHYESLAEKRATVELKNEEVI